MADEHAPTKYACLNQLSTEELESLLEGELLSGEEGDAGMTDYILGLLVEREQADPEAAPPSAARSRREFDALYRELEEPLYSAQPPQDRNGSVPLRRRTPRRLLMAAVAAALLVALACVPVLGYSSIAQMVAHWTAEQFSLLPVQAGAWRPSSRPSKELPEEFQELEAALREYGVEGLTVPDFPEGFTVADQLLYRWPDGGGVSFGIFYQNGDQHISFDVDYRTSLVNTIHEKDDREVEIYLRGGVTHYIFSNLDYMNAVWYDNGMEYSLGTNMGTETLKQLVDSMY